MDERLRYAWAAGFLDGDGCFALSRNSSDPDDLFRRPNVSAGQKYPEVLMELVELFGGTVRRGRQRGWGDGWYHQWYMGGAEGTKKVVAPILPYLVVKKREAEIILEFAGLIRRRGRTPKGKAAYGTDEVVQRRRLIAEMDEIRSR